MPGIDLAAVEQRTPGVFAVDLRAPGMGFFAVAQRETVIAPGIVFTAPRLSPRRAPPPGYAPPPYCSAPRLSLSNAPSPYCRA